VTEPVASRDALIRRLADAQREQDTVTMALIQLELDEILTGLAATEDQGAAAVRTAVEAAPNAAEVMAMDTAKVVNAALDASPSKIEDYRSAPAVPRNARVESHRQVPTVRDLEVR